MISCLIREPRKQGRKSTLLPGRRQKPARCSMYKLGSATFCSGLKLHQDSILTSSKPVKASCCRLSLKDLEGYRAVKMFCLPSDLGFLSWGFGNLGICCKGFLCTATLRTPRSTKFKSTILLGPSEHRTCCPWPGLMPFLD